MSEAVLRVRRSKGWKGVAIKFGVFIDEVWVAALRVGQTAEIPVKPGAVSVGARVSGSIMETMNCVLEPGEILDLTVGPSNHSARDILELRAPFLELRRTI